MKYLLAITLALLSACTFNRHRTDEATAYVNAQKDLAIARKPLFELKAQPGQTITLTGSSAIISWPAPSTDYVLEEATTLLTPTTTIWTPVGIVPTVSAGMNTVTITGAGAGQKFYRLEK